MSGMLEIPLNDLNLQQLSQLSQQLDKEVEVFQTSLSSLKLAQTKFSNCQECLDVMVQNNLHKDILVPLTSSIYVPGLISNTETVLVDIGTGYFIEMKIPAAKNYYKRKVAFLTQQMEKIQALLQEKFRFREHVVDILQNKITTQLSQQVPPSKA